MRRAGGAEEAKGFHAKALSREALFGTCLEEFATDRVPTLVSKGLPSRTTLEELAVLRNGEPSDPQ